MTREDHKLLIDKDDGPSTSVTAERKTYGIEDIGISDPIRPEDRNYEPSEPTEPERFWVLYAAEHLPDDGLEYRPDVDGQGPAPTQVTQQSVLDDVLVLERAARKLRKFVTGISNRTVEMAPPPKEPQPIDEATREKARRALAKSGFVRVTK